MTKPLESNEDLAQNIPGILDALADISASWPSQVAPIRASLDKHLAAANIAQKRRDERRKRDDPVADERRTGVDRRQRSEGLKP